MTQLLTAAQMRAIEQAAIASGEVTGLELMERAGRGVVEAILDWRPELATAPHRAVVLCGPGNNGGDGFVVARLLKERGWEVEVFLYGDEAKLPPDAAENCRRWRELGGVEPWREALCSRFYHNDIIVDALFGTGLTRPLPDEVASELLMLAKVYQFWDKSIAIDCPSGLCLDSGRALGKSTSAMPTGLTVTFQHLKRGHFLQDGPARIGHLAVTSIGLPKLDDLLVANALALDRDPITPVLSLRVRTQARGTSFRIGHYGALNLGKGRFDLPKAIERSIHKYHHGHALILSGGVGKGGAARLAARGALRIGAGLVTVGCPPAALQENAAALDAIMLAPLKDVDGLQVELRDRKIKAVCIGPGFGTGERLREFVAALLGGDTKRSRVKPGTAKGERPGVVLDADALTELRDDPETLFAMLHEGCVLTPHEGEFGRLFPDILAKLKEPATKGPAYSKVDATREAAARAGCVVLFKGADTVIAAPDGRCSINSAHYERAAPWLATAGSGDVLAGFITGLLARGLDPMAAAESAAWLHVECARKFGPGLIAEDLPEQLPAVFRDLGL